MLTDRSAPIIHILSKFLIPSSKSKLDQTQIPKSTIRYDMGQGGVGLGIFAALERSGSVSGSAKSANNQTAITRVYCDEGVAVRKCTRDADQNQMLKKKGCIFSLRVEDVLEDFPGPDFLNCCNLCRKKLFGKDIYMYRGEKAFCSEECRKVQIAKDERKDGCTSYGISEYLNVGARRSCPASARDQMLSTGIFAI